VAIHNVTAAERLRVGVVLAMAAIDFLPCWPRTKGATLLQARIVVQDASHALAVIFAFGRAVRVQPPHANEESAMTIKVGDRLPPGKLYEYNETATEGCPVGPRQVDIEELTRGRKVVIFGLPGAFTPTCSAKHVPSYVSHIDALRRKGIDEVICIAVNDAFVMGAWAREQGTAGKVRMLGDGSGTYTRALGLELDLGARGLGMRCERFSMLVDDGVVKTLNVETQGRYEVSGAETMLTQLG
jgi:peroxiredoxin